MALHVYNIAVGDRSTLAELFAIIRDQVARFRPQAAQAQPTFRGFRAGDVRHSLADVSKARRLLGYEPSVRVREGLERSAAWYAEHLGLAPGAQPRGTFRSP